MHPTSACRYPEPDRTRVRRILNALRRPTWNATHRINACRFHDPERTNAPPIPIVSPIPIRNAMRHSNAHPSHEPARICAPSAPTARTRRAIRRASAKPYLEKGVTPVARAATADEAGLRILNAIHRISASPYREDE